jgi:hypothetical protein
MALVHSEFNSPMHSKAQALKGYNRQTLYGTSTPQNKQIQQYTSTCSIRPSLTKLITIDSNYPTVDLTVRNLNQGHQFVPRSGCLITPEPTEPRTDHSSGCGREYKFNYAYRTAEDLAQSSNSSVSYHRWTQNPSLRWDTATKFSTLGSATAITPVEIIWNARGGTGKPLH